MSRIFKIAGIGRASAVRPETGTVIALQPKPDGTGTVYLHAKNVTGYFGWIPRGTPGAPKASCLGRLMYIRGEYHVELIDSTEFLLPSTSNPTSSKDLTMTTKTTIASAIDKNKNAATSAAFMEAGRIANNQVAKVAAKKLPLMARGYAETPLGKLVIANIAATAAAHFRPEDPRLAHLTSAMTVQAWQEVIQLVDIESVIDDLIENKDIKRALTKLPGQAAPDTE